MRGVQRVGDRHRVARSVQEIGIAERDVSRARRHLPRDVVEHDLDVHDTETSVVNGHDRAVTAPCLQPRVDSV